MSKLTKILEESIEKAIVKSYETALSNAETYASSGSITSPSFYVCRQPDMRDPTGKDMWPEVANYVRPLAHAKELAEKHPHLLRWDEEKEKRIINTAKTNIVANIMEMKPYLEKEGNFSALEGSLNIIKYIENY